jgi:hypothetical protein
MCCRVVRRAGADARGGGRIARGGAPLARLLGAHDGAPVVELMARHNRSDDVYLPATGRASCRRGWLPVSHPPSLPASGPSPAPGLSFIVLLHRDT